MPSQPKPARGVIISMALGSVSLGLVHTLNQSSWSPALARPLTGKCLSLTLLTPPSHFLSVPIDNQITITIKKNAANQTHDGKLHAPFAS